MLCHSGCVPPVGPPLAGVGRQRGLRRLFRRHALLILRPWMGPGRVRRRPVTDNWTQRFSEIFRDFVFGDFGGLPGRPRGPDFAKMWPRSVAKFWQSLSKIGALATPFVAKIRFCKMSKFREQNISERFSVYPYRNCSYLNFVLSQVAGLRLEDLPAPEPVDS